MSGFDRIKPPDRRLIDRGESRKPDSEVADRQGRAALFSASGQPTTTPRIRPDSGGGGAGGSGKVSKRTQPKAQAAPRGPAVDRRTPADEPDESRQPGARRSAKADGAPTSAADERLPQGSSPLHVECGHCGVTCPLPLGHALRQAVPLVLVAPWRSHPVFATCPCGERRAWLKPRLGPSR